MISKIFSKIRYNLFKLRYSRTIKFEGRNRVGKRVTINKYSYNNGILKVVLKKRSSIRHDVIIQGSGYLVLGEKSFIGSYSVIGCNQSITIGKNCMIAQSVSIRDTDHNFEDLNRPMIEQGITTGPITIKDNVWIGYGAVITKNITIEEGAIIAANAVVTKDVPKNAIVGGVPAKIIRIRD